MLSDTNKNVVIAYLHTAQWQRFALKIMAKNAKQIFSSV